MLIAALCCAFLEFAKTNDLCNDINGNVLQIGVGRGPNIQLSDGIQGLVLSARIVIGMHKKHVVEVLGQPEMAASYGPPLSPYSSFDYLRYGILINFDQAGKVTSVQWSMPQRTYPDKSAGGTP
ncbi:MAG TPA: hypothetical protein VE988_10235 [Gemmataceae bacterium]|nr:hypothetical protein [Gemmataceae bacterium]